MQEQGEPEAWLWQGTLRGECGGHIFARRGLGIHASPDGHSIGRKSRLWHPQGWVRLLPGHLPAV